jgi:di/tricarboxylate transporter
MDEAYKAINWKTIFLLASLIPLGQAMEATGAAAWIAQELVAQLGRMPSVLVQLAVALLTAAFAWIMGPAAAAVLMVPMAINIALALRVDPLVYALIAALGASNNFLTASNGVNALIAGPAGYRAADFRRVGLPLTACYALASVLLVNLFY